MIHSRRRARPDSTSAAAAASPRPRPSAPAARPWSPRTRAIRQLEPPPDTTLIPRGPTTAAARRPPPSTSTRSRPSATRTATPTARGSASSGRTRPSRTARSASRAATACGGGSANSVPTRPSPSGPSPCGGGAASACAAASTWGQRFLVNAAPFSARKAGRAAAPRTLMCWMLCMGPSLRAGCLPQALALHGVGFCRRCPGGFGPVARLARRLVTGSASRRPPRNVQKRHGSTACRSPGAGLPTRLAGTGS